MLGRLPVAHLLRVTHPSPRLSLSRLRIPSLRSRVRACSSAAAPPPSGAASPPPPPPSPPQQQQQPDKEKEWSAPPPSRFEQLVLRLFPLQPQALAANDSKTAVKFALGGNIFNTLVKYAAFLLTGSGTMLSEALHSTADVGNQSLLLIGINRASRPATNEYPYGFESERFVYALFSAIGIFFLGAGFSFVHGVTHLFNPAELEDLWIALLVLAASFGIESTTFLRGCASVFRSARELQMSFTEYVRKGPDPMAVAVIMEDGAALIGISIASVCLGATYLTGNPIYDALGSVLIGTLLGVIAVFLMQKNLRALIGHSAPKSKRRKIVSHVLNDPMVQSMHNVKSLQLGANSISFNADIEFEGRAVATKYLKKNPEILDKILANPGDRKAVEEYMILYGSFVVAGMGDEVDRIEGTLQKKFPDVKHVGLESN
eukprot:TRINITY_DN743_c1_g3_i1.p1 TRINITY_DN743_c1_g3~~TRINITY_DN743_c1_g3_i1.p1  ORF type:complete len:431 (+),score=74.57 TRINITY_DN743_c1_g3_i1:132-1424(+)